MAPPVGVLCVLLWAVVNGDVRAQAIVGRDDNETGGDQVGDMVLWDGKPGADDKASAVKY